MIDGVRLNNLVLSKSKFKTLSYKGKILVKKSLAPFEKVLNQIRDNITISSLKVNGIDIFSVSDLYNKLYCNDLTGVHNRRYMDEKLAKDIDEADVKGRLICAAYFDGDNMKYINDNFGHHTGNKEIIGLSRTIAKHFTTNQNSLDFSPVNLDEHVRFIHISGDEFMIVTFDSEPQYLIDKILEIKKAISHEWLNRKKYSLDIKRDTGNDSLIPPPISFTSAIVKKKPGESLYALEKRIDNILNITKESDRGSVYFEDSKILGDQLTNSEKSKYLEELVDSNKGKDNYFIICNFEYLDESIDRSGKITSHTLNSVKYIDVLLKEIFGDQLNIFRVNNNKSVIVLNNSGNKDFDRICEIINETINLDSNLNGKVIFNLGGQEMHSNCSAKDIIMSSERKLKRAQNTNQVSIIDRRFIRN